MTTLTWQSVQAEALRRIHSREWPPGAQIPNEAELAMELGCARATVNRALRELAEAGLLERRRKAGTRVSLHPVRKATLEIPIIRKDIESRGFAYGYRLLEQREGHAPADIQIAFGPPMRQAMIHVRALHLADSAPFCLEDRWINPAAVPGITTVDFAGQSANEWLVQNAAFSGGDFGFGAVNADEIAARDLGCTPGAALVTVERTTWAGSLPITSVRLSYAPGYRMLTTI
ncbi:GntR family transcriptional regulator [Pseudorhodobacter sp.]|uniref:GntR family transcriptional regulator n=1 Tax=Pseudorhodobacter sp. TaxID=1934400 RepID=UPI0026473108|nr:GntR family transcriptional regulator [Pseudorhodobacter sp.]MDN5787087.1 GntR family transcriptional regulator [Pseudorhodobacter sp.]